MGKNLQPRLTAVLYFISILAIGLTTLTVGALVVIKFTSLSLFSAMGENCAAFLTTGHDFLASSRWNYLLVTIVVAVVYFHLTLFYYCCTRMILSNHQKKSQRYRNGISCPALPQIVDEQWAAKLQVFGSGDEMEAQTFGFLRPRILISKGLIQSLSDEQLRAVLAHEAVHCSARDNLIIALARPFVLALFYLRSPRFALAEMHYNMEKAADKKAAATIGNPLVVAEAITSVASLTAGRRESQYATCADGNGDLSNRVEELIKEKKPALHQWIVILLSVAIIIAMCLGFASSALAMDEFQHREVFICYYHHDEENVNPHEDCPHEHSPHEHSVESEPE